MTSDRWHPTTWDDAAALLVAEICWTADGEPTPSSDVAVEAACIAYEEVFADGGDGQEPWIVMGAAALLALEAIGGGRREVVRTHLPAFLASKQHDYGCDNITRFGIDGLVVRSHDKVARLLNLRRRGAAAANEPQVDTLVDLVGYSVIALMLHNNWFTLPLKADLEALS